ncbi:MAG: FAD-dependent oxidoreductase [Deltaproteobacteria bacterium]|nr:FAD-dependent oxidoreductase [Deltaproteobacteria bacterium]
MSKRVAIIGGGIAGLTAAYQLNKRHDIVLFEKDGRLGGNAHTITTECGLTFDISVAVFGKNSYPNFVKLLDKLDIKRIKFSGSGIGMQNLDTKEEFFSTPFSLKGLIAQKLVTFHPRVVLGMLMGFIAMRNAINFYKEGKLDGLTMREALELVPGYTEEIIMGQMFIFCLVSSMYYEEIMDAPASLFFGKAFVHNDFFSIKAWYSLFTAENNTQSYVNALASNFSDKIVLNSKIKQVIRNDEGVVLKMENSDEQDFEKVVFACNADQALNLLEEPTEEEKNILSAWKYKDGPIVVHQDKSSFPEKEYYNLYTFLYSKNEGRVHTSVSGHIRNLKHIPDDCKFISSQHPNFPILEELVEYRKVFRTPIYDSASFATIKDLPSLNGKMNTYYCGSHFGYGLHEDAVTSAIEVSRMLGVSWT